MKIAAAVVPVAVCVGWYMTVIIILWLVICSCIFGFWVLLGLKVFDFWLDLFNALFLYFGLVVG